ncbi:hypothetical protein [uncultured Brevundimonas sp.]|uniref:hypothetical protein n=1 Tax=uncultured Brevundimonas sp. TaxID=213418 RepID=UPI0025E60F0D|nr:hypothetical protein [uncultured Brevundimonas sp.]
MSKPTATSSATLAIAAILGLAACERQPEPRPAGPPQPASAPPPAPATLAPTPTIGRAELLQGLDAAASAFAAGRTEEADASLAGRRFVVRQAFGCTGSSDSDEAASEGLAVVVQAAEGRGLRLSLAPGDWTESPLVAGSGETWEAAEGFWLTRPWMRAETCPVASAASQADEPVPPSPQTMGLAAVFEADGSRLGRRNGRAYSFVVRGDADRPAAIPDGGYRLVLEGRMAAFADGRAVRCRAAGPDQRPICIGAAQLDRVAFEDAQGAVLSEWRGG